MDITNGIYILNGNIHNKTSNNKKYLKQKRRFWKYFTEKNPFSHFLRNFITFHQFVTTTVSKKSCLHSMKALIDRWVWYPTRGNSANCIAAETTTCFQIIPCACNLELLGSNNQGFLCRLHQDMLKQAHTSFRPVHQQTGSRALRERGKLIVFILITGI